MGTVLLAKYRSKIVMLQKIIFLLLVVLNMVVMTDVAITTIGIATSSTNDLVPSSDWYFGTDVIYFLISIHIPNDGFIPKGANLTYTIEIHDNNPRTENYPIQASETYLFGQTLKIDEIYPLTSRMQYEYQTNGFLPYSIVIDLTLIYAGMVFQSLYRQVVITGEIR